jgi:hypothetical protein
VGGSGRDLLQHKGLLFSLSRTGMANCSYLADDCSLYQEPLYISLLHERQCFVLGALSSVLFRTPKSTCTGRKIATPSKKTQHCIFLSDPSY